jgi:hypothetical protein
MALEKECRQRVVGIYLIEEGRKEERGCVYEDFFYHPSEYLSKDSLPSVPTELSVLSHLL